MKNKNDSLILIVITVTTLVVAVIGASFAYFTAQKGTGASAAANVTTKTTDSLTYEAGSPININATQDNFGTGKPNLSSETFAKVSLRANNGTNNASYSYAVYLYVTANNFVYTTGSANTPELLMTITDPNNNIVTTLSPLTYKTVNGVSGFDITNFTGGLLIADQCHTSFGSMTTTSYKEEIWKIKVTFVNLPSDQQLNTNKNFNASITIENGPDMCLM